MKKYYVGITEDEVIWGVGTGAEQAIEDANNNIEEYYRNNPLEESPKTIYAVLATKRLYEEVSNGGYCHEGDYGEESEPYWIWNEGKADLIDPVDRSFSMGRVKACAIRTKEVSQERNDVLRAAKRLGIIK